MRSLTLFCLAFALACLTAACSDDDYTYPDLVTKLADLQTDETGTAVRLVTDDGTVWSIRPRKGLDDLTPDSAYRALARYAPTETDGEIQLYGATLAIAPVPVPAETFPEIKTDPVNIESIWRSGTYLNLIVGAMVKEEQHSFHFAEDGITTDANGIRTLHLTLVHDSHEDTEAFTRTVYLSVPLWAYSDTLQPGDNILLRLNTYDEGMTSRSFAY